MSTAENTAAPRILNAHHEATRWTTLVDWIQRRPLFDKPIVYVGRIHHSTTHFGNPFSHNVNAATTYPEEVHHVDTRAEAIELYDLWLNHDHVEHSFDLMCQRGVPEDWLHSLEPRREWILHKIHASMLRTKQALMCWCHPKPCHASVLLRMIHQP